ncbi:MAG: asparagine synthase (glutamine-hydrolyzing) [Candidatus Melainabacteria bacterium]|nr:asparagine synthase (glutamine-hydrolyzing) [Candidatus Melainabacteria bacterium]
MCGIAGQFTRDRQFQPNEAHLWNMIQEIRHRGPDHQAVYTEPGLGLAHARLSILDLNPRSNQPMHDASNGNVLVYNGEIYNYVELREQLSSKGYHFQTESDTEVILKAYDAWGTECLHRFNGMWAFVLYDRGQDALFMARDRYGIKPFVFAMDGQAGFVFASEHKAILEQFPAYARPNPPLLQHFLTTGEFSAFEESLYHGLYHLKPAHWAWLPRQLVGQPLRQKRYYQLPNVDPAPKLSLEEAGQHYGELLRDAIRLRFRSDVPVGCCMSGGLDSPTLVGLASQMFDTALNSFSCVYPGLPAVDESRYIQACQDAFQTRAFTQEPDYPDLMAAVDRSVWEQDGPTLGPSVLSQRAVMALAQGHVTVLIDGQGADETLGGYHGYFSLKLQALARDWLKNPTRAAWDDLWQQHAAIADRLGHSPVSRWKLLRRALTQPIQKRKTYAGHDELRHLLSGASDELDAALRYGCMVPLVDLLHLEDRNSMAFSLESRLPYLDYRLVDFAYSLPHAYKIDRQQTKALLRSAAKSVLPDVVLNRRDKMGFETPASHWFAQPANRAAFCDKLNSAAEMFEDLAPAGWLAEVHRQWQRYQSAWDKPEQRNYRNSNSDALLWRFLSTHRWLESLDQRQRHSFKKSPVAASSLPPTVAPPLVSGPSGARPGPVLR